MATTITEKSAGYARLLRAVLGNEKVTLKVGVFEQAKHENSNLSVAEIGNVHELGLGVPARPWLRPIVDGNRSVIRARIKRVAEQVAFGRMNAAEGMALVGQSVVTDIQNRIRAGIPPKLAESTKASKGGNKDIPLIHTGQFIGSITYRVEVKDSPRVKSLAKGLAKVEARFGKATKRATKALSKATKSAGRSLKRTRKNALRAAKKARRAVKKALK